MQNWDNLRFYLAVARSGTVSAAAKSLEVSHATVLRRVDQLEQELGVKLFRRLQSGYVLTESGSALYDEASRLDADTIAMVRRFENRDDELAGRLRVTQPENEIIDLYPIYARFIEQYPQIELDISPSSSVKNLNRHEAEVAIRLTARPPELLVGRKVGTVYFGAYVSASYLTRLGRQPGIEDCDWIIWHNESNPEQRNVQVDRLYGMLPNPRIIMQTTSVSDIISAIRAGIGAGLISHSIARQYDDLVLLPDSNISSRLRLWVLTHRDLRKVVRVQCFMRFVADALVEQIAAG